MKPSLELVLSGIDWQYSEGAMAERTKKPAAKRKRSDPLRPLVAELAAFEKAVREAEHSIDPRTAREMTRRLEKLIRALRKGVQQVGRKLRDALPATRKD